MIKSSVKPPSTIDALAWHAKRVGTSYGKLTAKLTSEEIQEIYSEYMEMIRKRQEEERIRIEKSKADKARAKK